MSSSKNAPIKFGILMVPYQVIDVAGPLDILSNCSTALVSQYEAALLPGMAGLTEKSIPITFHHISETLDPVQLTANTKVLPTTTCDTCPPLDYLLIGGPDPFSYTLSDRFSEFIKKHVAAGKGIFTTCTGALSISSSGVLDGKKATTNHECIELAKKISPNVEWREKDQWVVDGLFWTAGGACAGMDMFAHWVESLYGKEILAVSCALLDFEPRDVAGKRILKAEA